MKSRPQVRTGGIGRKTINTMQNSSQKPKFRVNANSSKVCVSENTDDDIEYDKLSGSTILIGQSFSDEDDSSVDINSDVEGAENILGLSRTKSISKARPKEKPKSHSEILSEVINFDEDDPVLNPDSSNTKSEQSNFDSIFSDNEDPGRYDYLINNDDDLQIRDETFFRAQREKIIANGKAEGYPTTFNREEIIERSNEFIDTLKKIITGQTNSYYHNQAEIELTKYFCSVTKSRDPAVHRLRFGTLAACDNPMSIVKSTTLNGLTSDSGYFGEQGQEALTKNFSVSLFDVFEDYVRETEIESTNNWWMRYFGFTNYLILVLVPETLTYLIGQDRDIFDNEARQVLKDSSSYGAIMFPNTFGDDQIDHSSVSDSSENESYLNNKDDLEEELVWDSDKKEKISSQKEIDSFESLGESKKYVESDLLLASDEEKPHTLRRRSSSSLSCEAPTKKKKVTNNIPINYGKKYSLTGKGKLGFKSENTTSLERTPSTKNSTNLTSHLTTTGKVKNSKDLRVNPMASNNSFFMKLAANKPPHKKVLKTETHDHDNANKPFTKNTINNSSITTVTTEKKISTRLDSNKNNDKNLISASQNSISRNKIYNASQKKLLKNLNFQSKDEKKITSTPKKSMIGIRKKIEVTSFLTPEKSTKASELTKHITANKKISVNENLSDSDDDLLSNIFNKK